MFMKNSRRGICALIAAGLLAIGSYGQDSLKINSNNPAPQANPSAGIPTDLTPAQLDSLTRELEGLGTRRESKAQIPEAAPIAPKTDTAAKKSQTVKAPGVPAPVVTKKTPAPDSAAQPAMQKAQTQEAAKLSPKTDSVKTDSAAKTHETVKAPSAPVQAAPAVAKKPSSADKASSRGASDDEKVMELENDVVVGYGTMRKEDLTGSVISVKSDELAKDAVFSIRKAMQGRAAGVSVTSNSGAPGKAMTVRIRGVGTINNSEPLYVVDGTPVSGVDILNPEDIESMTILKDASATAIYGSRGANGVVMVTTKKAKEGMSKINYDMYVGVQNPWRKPSLCNAEQWAMLRNEASRAANLPVDSLLENPSSLGAGTNWFDQITNNNALIHKENISVMRGNDKLKYFLSAGYFDQQGIIKGSELEKETFRINTENKVTRWLTLGNNFGLTHSLTNYANESDEWNSVLVNALSIDPVSRTRDKNGNLDSAMFSKSKNPVGIIENTNITGKKTAMSGTIFSDIGIANILKFRTTFGLDMAFNDSTEFLPKYRIKTDDRNDNARLTRKTSTDNTWVLENTLSYEKVFADIHTVKLMAGAEALDREWDSLYAQNQITASNDTTQRVMDATKSTSPTVRGLSGGNTLASAFGRLEYDYNNKYLLTATFRRDGSSRFGPGNRWGDFPSVAGAWKVTQEPFMKDVSFIEGMKLRLGWGKTGNQEIPDYLFSTNTSGNQNYPLGGVINTGTTFLSAGNPQIHWEELTSTNGGLDLSLLDGKIEFTGDAFVKTTNDMLIKKAIPMMAGSQTPPMVNVGSIQNKGLELTVIYKETIGEILSNLGINFSTYGNKVLDLGDTSSIVDANFKNAGFVTKTQKGHPVGSFYGFKTNGLFQNWDEVKSYTYVDKNGTTKLVQPNAKPGDIRYRDDNHDGQIDEGYIGSPHPDFIMGLSADVAYKGLDISVLFQGVYGNQIFNGTRWYTENGTAASNLDTRMLNRWTGDGSTNDVAYPRMDEAGGDNMQISDRYIEDGSYLRLKSLQLGYSLNESVCKKLWIKKCRLYVGAENLFTFTRYTGLDPEIGTMGTKTGITNSSLTMGVDYVTYPQPRTFFMGLNITL